MDIIMVRHGETEDNLEKIYSRDNTSLTLLGIEQIKDTKKTIKDLNFSKVYYSPLRRTKETLEHLGLEGISEKRLQEVDFGIFKGMDYNSILKRYPRETKMWNDDYVSYAIPEGESLDMVYSRLKDFLEELIENDEDVLLVTHEGIIRLVCCWIFDSLEYVFKFKADNGSVNIVSIVDDYKYIEKLNFNPRLNYYRRYT